MELIKIIENKGKKAVSARDLHMFLEVETRFNDWIKRMFEYGFMENEDFEVLLKNEYNPNGGRPEKEYVLSIDCAKEISMIQRSERGRKARQYFIECERKLKESNTTAYSNDPIIQIRTTQIEQQKEIDQLKANFNLLEAKVMYFDSPKQGPEENVYDPKNLAILPKLLHISNQSFYQACNIRPGIFARIIQGNEPFNESYLGLVMETFPEVNDYWLRNESDLIFVTDYTSSRIKKIKRKPNNFKTLISVLCETFHMSHKELADFIGITPNTISALKHGYSKTMNRQTIDKFYTAFPTMSKDWLQTKCTDKANNYALLGLSMPITIDSFPNPEYLTVRAYANIKRIPCPKLIASKYGRMASKYCKENNIPTYSVPDETYGSVKSYRIEALEYAFMKQ